jgi:hypothetical protein
MQTVQRRRRTVLARFAAASLVVALGAAGTLLAPSAATAADDRISVRSITQFGPDSAGYHEIIGEVQNAGATALGPVRVDFSFYSANNTLLSTDYTFSDVSRLAPGEKSPFSLHFEPVPEYDHYSYGVSDADFSFQSVNHNFTVTVTNRYNDGLFEHVVGTVRNDNTTTAEFVSVVGTAYAADGTAVDASESFINNSSKELAPGTSATYELIFFSGRPFQNYALLAESSSTPSTDSSSPSPAPSTTQTPAPSTSQSASPSPATTPNRVPSISVAPFVVRFGQPAYVTISGTPGATIDLFIRKYRGDFIKIRDGLVLDAGGSTTVETRPDMNLRFMAKDRSVAEGSSIGGTDGLMTVEKYVSINVKRVGVHRFTFSGSINPLHPGAAVNLYRNGSLIKAGIPVNSSRIYSATVTLPAGTANYRITSPTTGYNNLSHSPTRSVRVY